MKDPLFKKTIDISYEYLHTMKVHLSEYNSDYFMYASFIEILKGLEAVIKVMESKQRKRNLKN